jgi:hypothetical protein
MGRRSRLGQEDAAIGILLIFILVIVLVVLVIEYQTHQPPVVEKVVYYPNGSTIILILNPNNHPITVDDIELGGGVIKCTFASSITLPPGISKLVGYISTTGMGSLNNTLVSCINEEAIPSETPERAIPPPWG